MQNRHDRLTKYGVVALAGIAVLGWIREPEKDQALEDSVTLADSRTTFPPPTAVASVPDLNDLPGDPASVHASDRSPTAGSVPPSVTERARPAVVEAGQQSSDVNKTHQQESANGGRHEGPGPQSAEPATQTRSREPQEERPLEPQRRDGAARNPERSQDDTPNTGGRTQPSVVSKKERSKGRSAAIIVGAAAAGAAIGGATGGGKGAAIGAITGGAGGYVYDRMTRRNGISKTPAGTDIHSGSQSDADSAGDAQRYNRAPSLARTFGTPTFTGR